jgi:uncharacterized radical SAM superfamily Fe-S cluster-containing enzyme
MESHTLGSVCSTCLKAVDAHVVQDQDGIWLEKTCPEHGFERVLESRDAAFYHIAAADSACCKPGESCGPTCVALVEVTDACNLECPLCYAASGPSGGWEITRDEMRARIDAEVAQRGPVDIVMISGGEPTVHPELDGLLKDTTSRDDVGRVLFNTNGLLLGRPGPARDALLANRDKLEVYLQFDSLNVQRTKALRGGTDRLVARKLAALDWLEEINLPTTLAVALERGTPAEELAAVMEMALERPHVRGVTLQPAFASGRHARPYDPANRLTTPDVVDLVCEALPEQFAHQAFTNLPCSHPNCAIVAYYYRMEGKVWPLTTDLNPRESLRGRINFNLEDLAACGCDTTELGAYIRKAEISPSQSFRIVVKPFMDRFTLNRDRTAQCCTYVLGPDAKRMSFCEYNVFREQLRWNENRTQPAQVSTDCGTGCGPSCG